MAGSKNMPRKKKKLTEVAQQFSMIMTSINYAVIITDTRGFVIFMNPIAEALTGWKLEEALDKNFTEVFNIVCEQTGNIVENPATKVIRDGAIAKLEDYILIAKDGVEKAVNGSWQYCTHQR